MNICRYYRTEDDCCSFYDLQDMSDDLLRQQCRHVECSIGCYVAQDDYHQMVEDCDLIKLIEPFDFHCSTVGIADLMMSLVT